MKNIAPIWWDANTCRQLSLIGNDGYINETVGIIADRRICLVGYVSGVYRTISFGTSAIGASDILLSNIGQKPLGVIG